MKSTNEVKRKIFVRLRQSLDKSQISSPIVERDALLCPLCWTATKFVDLTLEHVIPSSVGGSRCTLTCKQCNNTHGSKIDKHLKIFQDVRDNFAGRGTIPAKMKLGEHVISVDLDWQKGHNNIAVRELHSNPKSVEEIKNAIAGDISPEFNLQFKVSSELAFKRAVLRSAYLALFNRFEYAYVSNDAAQYIRKRICDPSAPFPALASLVAEAKNWKFLDPVTFVPGTICDTDFVLVVIRLQGTTVSHHAVFMPLPHSDSALFFQNFMLYRNKLDNSKFNISESDAYL